MSSRGRDPDMVGLKGYKSARLPFKAATAVPFMLGVDDVLSDLELVGDFVDEATERLDLVGDHALSAEDGDSDAWHALRREIHTLKGAAGFLGLDAFSELCHELEDFLLRTDPGNVGGAFDTVHEAVEHLRELVEEVNVAAHQGVPLAPSPRAAILSSRLRTG